jgi:hypothetical protein
VKSKEDTSYLGKKVYFQMNVKINFALENVKNPVELALRVEDYVIKLTQMLEMWFAWAKTISGIQVKITRVKTWRDED